MECVFVMWVIYVFWIGVFGIWFGFFLEKGFFRVDIVVGELRVRR